VLQIIHLPASQTPLSKLVSSSLYILSSCVIEDDYCARATVGNVCVIVVQLTKFGLSESTLSSCIKYAIPVRKRSKTPESMDTEQAAVQKSLLANTISCIY
jgi:hypothetical protein